MAEKFTILNLPEDADWREWIIATLNPFPHYEFQEFGFRSDFDFVLLIVSEHFDPQKYPEWTYFFNLDPTGRNRLLRPVKVSEYNLKGLFGAIVVIDLTGLDGKRAEDVLLDGLQTSKRPQRPPHFPKFE